MKDHFKHVYIIGSYDDEKYIGFVYDKNDAKEYIDVRKNRKLGYVKMKTSKFKPDDHFNEELVRTMSGQLMTISDEEWMLQAWDQYLLDTITNISNFLKLIEYIKFTELENKFVKELRKFLEDYLHFREHYDESDMDDIYDHEKVVNFFIENIGG